MNSIRVERAGREIACASGEHEVFLLYRGAYEPGDSIVFTSDAAHAVVQVDQSVMPARLYLPAGTFSFRPPLEGDGLAVYPPHAFEGNAHLITLRPVTDNPYRNLAENPADQRGEVTAYPHATANVETRNESVFAARNVIDGQRIANGHGEWPYGSWGIGAREDAWCLLEFGREVEVDAMALTLRADFPHDAYWVSGHVVLSDGAEIAYALEKTGERQRIELGSHRVTWMRLERMQKSDDPSAFPSLRQWEVFGRDIP